MKKFEFTLASLKKYREQVLDGEKATLSVLRSELNDMETELKQTLELLGLAGVELMEMYEQGTHANEIALQKRYISTLQAEVHQWRHKIMMKEREIEGQLSNVVLATQEVRKLEKLEEQQLEEYKAAAAKEDELFIEEFVSNADWRKNNIN